MRLVLASGSPRRRALLEEAGIEHEVLPVDVDETPPRGLNPEEVALVLARRKARKGAGFVPDGLVVAADTVVVLNGAVLGKPLDPAGACRMLSALSSRWHRVVTGVCLIDAATGETRQRAVTTMVRFRPLSAREIREYVDTGEPLDKAGAYAIQGGAADFVSGIEGSRTNVIGLPMDELREMLR